MKRMLSVVLMAGLVMAAAPAGARESKGRLRDAPAECARRIVSATQTGNEVQVGDAQRVGPSSHSHRLLGTLIGLGAGTAVGVAVAYAARGEVEEVCPGGGPPGTGCDHSWTGSGNEAFYVVPIFAGVGAGLGALVGHFVRGSRTPPHSTSVPDAHRAGVSVAPVVTRRTAGLAVAVWF